MGRTANLVRRGATYYCRMRCPKHLLREGNKVEKSLTLDTKERSVAIERLPAARLEIMAFFQGEAKRPDTALGIFSRSPSQQRPTDPALPILRIEEVAPLSRWYFNSERDALELGTADLIRMDVERLTDWRQELANRLASLDHPTEDEDDPALAMEISLLRRAGRRSEYSSDPSRLLRSHIQRAMRQLYSIELARIDGDFRDIVTDSLFRTDYAAPKPIAEIASQTPIQATVTDVVSRFRSSELDENADITSKTKRKIEAALGIIERHFGPDRDLASITGADCRTFRNLLSKLPPNLNKRFGADISLEDVAASVAAKGEVCMARQTQVPYLHALNRLLDFAKTDGLISENPFPANLRPRGKAQGREKARNAYSDAQLRAIFNAPIYTGCVDDERKFSKPMPGNVIRRSRFWLPLIALFTGLRMEEILQLTKWHIHTAPDGLPCFLMSSDMRVKTRASYRVVPMHEQLVRIGLVDFAASKGDDHALLFDDVPPGADDYRSSTFSKRYRTFTRSLNLKEAGRNVSFHSFRHNFRDALRLPDINPDLTKEIGGWSRGSDVDQSYGDGARAVHLRPVIDSITYDVDFSHLYVRAAGDNPGA